MLFAPDVNPRIHLHDTRDLLQCALDALDLGRADVGEHGSRMTIQGREGHVVEVD